MNSYAEYIKTVIGQEPENKLLEASVLYQRSFGTIPEMTYYKTLERMSTIWSNSDQRKRNCRSLYE